MFEQTEVGQPLHLDPKGQSCVFIQDQKIKTQSKIFHAYLRAFFFALP